MSQHGATCVALRQEIISLFLMIHCTAKTTTGKTDGGRGPGHGSDKRADGFRMADAKLPFRVIL
jgi:hypothetical protein